MNHSVRKAKRKVEALRKRRYAAAKNRNIQAQYDEKTPQALRFGTTGKFYGDASRYRTKRQAKTPTAKQIEIRSNLRLIANAAYDFPVVRDHAAAAGIILKSCDESQYRFDAAGYTFDFYVCHMLTNPQLALPVPCNLHDVLKAVIEEVDLRNLQGDSRVASSDRIATQAGKLTVRSIPSTNPPDPNREGSAHIE